VGALSFAVEPDADSRRGSYHLRWPASNRAPSPLQDAAGFIAHAGTVLNPLIRPHAATGAVATTANYSGVTSAATSQQQHQHQQWQWQDHAQAPTHAETDTVVYPLAQFTPLLRPDTSTEYPAMLALLRHLRTTLPGARWMLTAGYFNIRPELQALLLASRCARGTVVTASPWANGFYGSRGVSGMLPAAYTLLARRFLESAERAAAAGAAVEGEAEAKPGTATGTKAEAKPGMATGAKAERGRIELREWRRGTVGAPGGWTYHAKGLWVALPDEHEQEAEPPLPRGQAEAPPPLPPPSLTLVGSSNYTQRSHSLDLEMNALVLTRSADLQARLAAEAAWLQRDARPVDQAAFRARERRVGLHVRVAMWIVALVGGAL
jgi:CDP-diacylglycerol--glycerol-3-phosphate 3-phosphatidyltransferase